MPDDIDWSVTTFEGNRRRQHEEFLALPLREKLERLEQMAAVAEFFASRRAMREAGNKSRAAEHGEPGERREPHEPGQLESPP